jgi:hypothetical protein
MKTDTGMNLRMADAPGLVAILHRVIQRDGEAVPSVQDLGVVTFEGSLFYLGSEPVTVGGPFDSLEALVRSEGLRRHHEPEEPEPRVEVFEWSGAFFRLEGGEVERFAELEGAMAG